MTPRVTLRTVLAVALALVACARPIVAQTAGPVLDERLFPIPGADSSGVRSSRGFLGFWSEGSLARLTTLDDTLAQRAASSSYGLQPLDLAWQPALGRAILLAYPAGAPALFSVPARVGARTPPPDPEVFWLGEGASFRRIVATGDFDADGRQEVAIVGDSSFAIIGTDGVVRARIAAAFVGAHQLAGNLGRFALIARDGGGVTVSLFDARTRRILERRELPLRGRILSLHLHGQPTTLAVASTRPGSAAWIIDIARGLDATAHPLPRPIVALVPYDHEGRPGIAALVRRRDEPQVVPLVAGTEPITIDFPLSLAFESVASTSERIALLTADSVALYSRSWTLLGATRSPGTESPELFELGGSAMLLSTASGSVRFILDGDGPSWLARHWAILVAALGLLVTAGAVIGVAQRYSLVQSIYFNLVGVPSSHGVIVLSRTQRVTQMNGSARALLGVSTYIPLGRHISEYIARDELRGIVASLRRLFVDGESFEQRLDIEGDGGPRAITFRGRTMLTRGGFRSGYLLLVEDVTRTIAQERLVNWASVAHHIAHEMKTPLGTVRMTAEMLRDRLSTDGYDDDYLRATARILRQSERLREIVDDLLTVARTESLQKSRADFSLLVASLAHDYREYLPPNVELDVAISGEDHRCTIDVQQTTVALRNLLDNARHAIGGRDGGRIGVTLAATPDRLDLVVEDNGVGMRPETLARLFQPFYSEREGGSGIGTVIIKRVFEAHGGTVEVESAAGVGTRFAVSIPRE